LASLRAHGPLLRIAPETLGREPSLRLGPGMPPSLEAAEGRGALREARSGKVDAVVTDLVMPEQEGIETIQALRRELPNVGIIAISGAFGGRFLRIAQELGADAVLSKPLSAGLLVAKVEEVLLLRR